MALLFIGYFYFTRVGQLELQAKQKAVDSVMREWFYAFTPKEEGEEASVVEIFDAYVDFWADEETFEFDEQEI